MFNALIQLIPISSCYCKVALKFMSKGLSTIYIVVVSMLVIMQHYLKFMVRLQKRANQMNIHVVVIAWVAGIIASVLNFDFVMFHANEFHLLQFFLS